MVRKSDDLEKYHTFGSDVRIENSPILFLFLVDMCGLGSPGRTALEVYPLGTCGHKG